MQFLNASYVLYGVILFFSALSHPLNAASSPTFILPQDGIDKNLFLSSEAPPVPKMNTHKEPFVLNMGNVVGKFQIKFKPESFFARNANILNSARNLDRTILSRHTIDFNLDLLYGNKCFGYDTAEFFVTLRNKATWGNNETIAQTTEATTVILESVQAPHKHFITKHIIWIREIWLKFAINEAISIHSPRKHFFTLGSFPFELGRGISLGSAYAVNPGTLGFFSDNTIDQYAYGFKLNGDIVENKLSYDLYGAYLENRSDSFNATAARIRGQEYGHRMNQERGSGHINYVIASRAKWTPVKAGSGSIFFEPYVLYNHVPELKIEFLDDSSAKLATFGLAGEFTYKGFEWGFDGGFNTGQQKVKGWDRNRIDQQNVGGFFALINSRVFYQDSVGGIPGASGKAPHDPSTTDGITTQQIINSSVESQAENGQVIGSFLLEDGITTRTLTNDINRFSDPYHNVFRGWMFVGDVAYKIRQGLKVAAMFGIASGDENPNKDFHNPNDSNVDGNYKGFIPLQEIYSGGRVQSAMFLGGLGRIPRPLSTPRSSQVIDNLPSTIGGFTNLIFTGAAVHSSETYGGRSVNIRPNILLYWQQYATKKFDVLTKLSLLESANPFLGTEVNVFTDAEFFRDCKIFAVLGVFFPGAHYKDIKGKPLNREQQKLLNSRDVTGIEFDNAPLLGTDTAYALNIGLEYKF